MHKRKGACQRACLVSADVACRFAQCVGYLCSASDAKSQLETKTKENAALRAKLKLAVTERNEFQDST